MSFLLCATGTRRLVVAASRSFPGGGGSVRRGFEILIDPKALAAKSKRKSSRRQQEASRRPSYRFVDKTRIRVMGGYGGKGSLSQNMMRRKHHLRPDGGHGGNGGCVILVADPNEQSLKWSRPHAQAENGANGSSQEKLGRNGKNLILRVPCGVVVRKIVKPGEDMYDDREEGADEDSVDENNANPLPSDDETKQKQNAATAFSSWDVKRDEENNAGVEFFPLDDDDGDDPFDDFDSENMNNTDEIDSNPSQQKKIYLIDLDKPGAHIMVARGGRGGYGSMMYASDHGPLPEARILIANAQPAPPEVTYLELELKLIADVGTIGFPNAGKSSLLRAMSRAAPEVAPYPFTTLHPLMGVVEYRDGMHIKVADIPGLIAGASEGRGKGIDFLRHVERTKALMYVLDVAGTEGRDPHDDLRVLVDELSAYGDGTLLQREALVVANKIDLVDPYRLPELLASIQQIADELGIKRHRPVAGISAGVSGEGLASLSRDIRSVVESIEKTREAQAV